MQYKAQKQPFIDMLSQFDSMWDGHHGCVTMGKHRIELLQPEKAPVHAAPYQTGPESREAEKIEIDKMLTENVTEPTQTKWAALIVFAPERDCTLLFCVDYSNFNAVVKQGSYAIPRMDKCIDSLDESTVLLTINRFIGDICKSRLWMQT